MLCTRTWYLRTCLRRHKGEAEVNGSHKNNAMLPKSEPNAVVICLDPSVAAVTSIVI